MRWVVTVSFGAGRVRQNAAVLAAREGVRLLVVDNQGTYGPPAHGEEVLVGHGNVGFGAGNNLAVRSLLARRALADEDLLFFVNPDVALDEPAADFIATARPPGDAIVYLGSPGVRRFYFAPALGVATTLPVGVEVFRGCFFCLRAGALLRVGPLAEGYFLYGEEVDYVLRARAAGLRVVRAAAPLVEHAQGTSSRAAGAFHRYYFRSRVVNFRRFARRPAAQAPVLLASLALMTAKHVRSPGALRQACAGVVAGLAADLSAFEAGAWPSPVGHRTDRPG